MKFFETWVGDQLRAWEATDKVTISKKADQVTIVNTETEVGRARTVFNLKVLPFYSYA